MGGTHLSYVDQYGTTIYTDKLPKEKRVEPQTKSPFRDAVEAKVESSSEVGGWPKGPDFIAGEMGDEAVDIVAWGRGLHEYPMTAEQADRLLRIEAKSHEIWGEVMALRASYG